jgi:hypothetical protein
VNYRIRDSDRGSAKCYGGILYALHDDLDGHLHD